MNKVWKFADPEVRACLAPAAAPSQACPALAGQCWAEVSPAVAVAGQQWWAKASPPSGSGGAVVASRGKPAWSSGGGAALGPARHKLSQ